MKIAKKIAKLLRKQEDGAEAIEYALIASLISIVAIASITAVGKSANETFETIAIALEKAESASHQQK